MTNITESVELICGRLIFVHQSIGASRAVDHRHKAFQDVFVLFRANTGNNDKKHILKRSL